MTQARFIFFAAAIIAASGCASNTPARPDWAAGDSARYKSSQYLIGRGQAATQEEAKDRARADIAKTFKIAVAVASEDIQRYKTMPGGAGQYESQASRSISTRTDQIVSGIQIAELWQDPASNTYYALAVLPRLQTAAALRQQVSELDDATGNYVEQSRNSADLFIKIAAAKHAIDAQEEREALQRSLQVVDLTGRGVDPQWALGKLKADMDALLKRVHIAPKMSSDSAPGLAPIVAGALAKSGFMIETGKNPDFILQANLALNDLGAQDGWYWQRGTLEVTLTEAANGRVRGTKRWEVKASATDRMSSVKRALDQADAILNRELRTTLTDMATSQ